MATSTTRPSERMFAFIRAINTGQRRVTNEQVVAPFIALGLVDVAAYQAAGNVAFRCDREPGMLDSELTDALSNAYGFDAPTFVRTLPELRAAIGPLPFPPDVFAATEGRAQITFMSHAPTPEQARAVHELVPAADEVIVRGREWLWLPRAGVSGSELPVARIERIVGPMTMRTIGTVERMLAKFSD
jgi:uncharacterized protein (DUF1697 family)